MVDSSRVYGGLASGKLSSFGIFVVLIAMLGFLSSTLSVFGINPVYTFGLGLLLLSYPMYKLYQRDRRTQERYMESSIRHQMKREEMLASFAKSQGKCQSCFKLLDEEDAFCQNCGHQVKMD